MLCAAPAFTGSFGAQNGLFQLFVGRQSYRALERASTRSPSVSGHLALIPAISPPLCVCVSVCVSALGKHQSAAAEPGIFLFLHKPDPSLTSWRAPCTISCVWQQECDCR